MKPQFLWAVISRGGHLTWMCDDVRHISYPFLFRFKRDAEAHLEANRESYEQVGWHIEKVQVIGEEITINFALN